MEKKNSVSTKKTVRRVVIILAVIAAAAAAIWCLYRYLKPDYLEDLDDDNDWSGSDAGGTADAAEEDD